MPPKPPRAGVPAGRVRPPDRRAHIVAAATIGFSEHGFHGTKLSEIADSAGISAPALYRHFANKSDLLGAVVRDMSARVQAALAAVPPQPGAPEAELTALLDAYVANVLAHRHHSDIYRWEWQSLAEPDREFARGLRREAHRRTRGLIAGLRPDLSRAQCDALTDAVFAIASSPGNHRVTLPRKIIGPLLRNAALAAVHAELPANPSASDSVPGLTPNGRRETILTESVVLFADRGFHDVTVEDIAAAVGLPPSGVYRHFPSKQAILTAALHRASERTTSAISAGLAQSGGRDEALVRLAEQYTRLCVAEPAIVTAYRRCIGTLDEEQRAQLRRQQRTNVDEWSTWLLDARPEVPPNAARFLVHAALDAITDLTCHDHPTDAATATAIALAVLRETSLEGVVRERPVRG
ncbi:TetR/AcrR family transcriptional regulator [Gordonia phosphorivorans]|uniref:TetR/AcrR family transcriptional regulator n=1 Tax=Gordonia phosphorivorans TaxID=1056982 RepID=A0ABV6H5R3_9ACTN